MAASRSSQRNAREFFELKQRAVQFYKENKVPEKLEDILNSMVYDHPPDVYGRLSEYFESISKPVVISKLRASQVLDSRGQPTIEAYVHCIKRGIEKCMASGTMASFNYLTDTAPTNQKESEDEERQESVSAAIEHIQGPITEGLSGLDPTQQKEADDIVCSIINKLQEEKEALEPDKVPSKVEIAEGTKSDISKSDTKNVSPAKCKKKGSARSATVLVQEPKEPMFSGCNAICVVSQAVASTGSEVKGIPLYQHIASLRYKNPPYQFSFPIPMVTVLSSGKAAPGKQNLIKEVLVIPKPDVSFSKSLEQLTQIYQQVSKLHFSKVGVAAFYTNDFGGICPQYDRPDQLLDHVTEALLSLDLTAGEDVFIGLNCAAHEIYDTDKGKYEVTSGALKTADDMVEVYADIIARYPGVIALIDPIKKHDVSALKRLCTQYSEKCFILGDQIYPRPEKFLLTGFDDIELNGATLKLQQMTSVTDVVNASRIIHDRTCVSVIAGVQGDTTDPFLADLAVGVQATFVKFGAPTRGERVALYNRLTRISDELASKDALIPRTEFPFCAIHQPEPEPQDDDSVP